MTGKGRKLKQNSNEEIEHSGRVRNIENNVEILTKNMMAMQEAINKLLHVSNKDSLNEKTSEKNVQEIASNSFSDTRVKYSHFDRGYIAFFKDLGGNNINFVPGGVIHPVDFIRKLDTVFNDAEVPPVKRIDLAISALRGSAATWASARRGNFITYEDFSKAFLDRYWGIKEERAVFRTIQYGNYESGSRSEYFLKLVKENNYLTKPLAECELVSLIVKHFNQQVRRGILNNGLSGIDEIDAYLRELDSTYYEDRTNNSVNSRGYRNRNNENFDRQGGSQNRNSGVRETENRNREGNYRRVQRAGNENQNTTVNLLAPLHEENIGEMLKLDVPKFNNEIEKEFLSDHENVAKKW